MLSQIWEAGEVAIWQFRLHLIPAISLRKKFGAVPIAIPEELAEDYPWWASVQVLPRFEELMDGILPRSKSWSTEMLIWGDEEGDTANVGYDGNRNVEWIEFRLDVRELSLEFVGKVCRLAKELDCVFLTRANHVITPEHQLVINEVNRSIAKEYVDDPASTLLRLKPDQDEFLKFEKKGEPRGPDKS